ncbi:MAG: MgtC/SapB family protein [bacterium]|nr:MgtC/SapB family protein [bacterium]
MLPLETMLLRLGVAILCGAVFGIEREFFAKREAGIRTSLIVSAGAAIFSIVGLSLPSVVGGAVADSGPALNVIANIVIGVGFLGAGIIIHQGPHVRGLTTAATVWLVAAVGVLAGVGLVEFALVTTAGMTILLSLLRRFEQYLSPTPAAPDDYRPPAR